MLHECFHFLFRQPGQQAFADARGMQKHAAAHPGIHPKKSRGLYLFDIHRFALVQYGKVHGQVNSLHECTHERQGDVSDIEVGLGVAAKTQDSGSRRK